MCAKVSTFSDANDFELVENMEGFAELSTDKCKGDGLVRDPDSCAICGGSLANARILNCLHSFCDKCLNKELMDEGGDAGSFGNVIQCPTCRYGTRIGIRNLEGLPLDVTKTNIWDVTNVSHLYCTSCTTGEVAKSRCNSCHNLLCNQCDMAHRYMRCFEAHTVIDLDEMRKRGLKIIMHKPLHCDLHPNEPLMYYCDTCSVTVCLHCMKQEHRSPEHHCEGILDSEMRVRQEIKSLLFESQEQVRQLLKLTPGIDTDLNELERQRSVANALIHESYEKYRIVLEKTRDEALSRLDDLYNERELLIIKENRNIGEALSNLEDATDYTSHLLQNSTVSEIMYLRKIVVDRLLELNRNVPKGHDSFLIDFQTDLSIFESMARNHFGYFRTEKPLDNTPIEMPMFSPISLCSMNSSFSKLDDVSDLNCTLRNFSLTPSPQTSLIHPNSGAMPNFSSITEYNLAKMSPSPHQSRLDLSDILANESAYKSMASMAHLGAFSPQARYRKMSPMQIHCKFGQLGSSLGQFNSPHGFCLGQDEDTVVADTNNHRIQVFDKSGLFKFQFGESGTEDGYLWYPRKVAVVRASGKYVICDRGTDRSRMQIFNKEGVFIKSVSIRFIDIVSGLVSTSSGEIVAVDSVSPTVFVMDDTGVLIRWFDCSDHMREPSDITTLGDEYYICDFKGHNVVVFTQEGQFLRRIGYEGVTNFPNGIDISDAGDVLVGDSHGNRFHVAVFSKEGILVSEFECPYVKVSRCCGLKITSEGYVVTLAKNNHHVLMLNTLYIL